MTAADVSAFMLEQSACRSMGSLGKTGLGALLRFLYLRRYTPLPLALRGARGRRTWRRPVADAFGRSRDATTGQL